MNTQKRMVTVEPLIIKELKQLRGGASEPNNDDGRKNPPDPTRPNTPTSGEFAKVAIDKNVLWAIMQIGF